LEMWKRLRVALQKVLLRILKMPGTSHVTCDVTSHFENAWNIACHMRCHLAFSKCDWIFGPSNSIAFCARWRHCMWHAMLPGIFKMWSNTFCSVVISQTC
jgi:hypothetical protein